MNSFTINRKKNLKIASFTKLYFIFPDKYIDNNNLQEKTMELNQAAISQCLTHIVSLTHCNRKSNLCIPRKGIAWPQSQLLHSCVCEDRSTYLAAANRQTDPGNILYKST